jgi:hypothetical protein
MYDWKGTAYPSVTSIIRYGVAKPRLISWTADKIIEQAIRSRQELAALTDRKAKKLLIDLTERDRNAAADKGTAIHEQAENFALGKAVDLTPEIEGYVQAFDNFCYDFQPEFLYTEALVISRTYEYAGTLDAIVKIDGKVYVLDIKTGNYIWPEVALQLAAYSRADFLGDRNTGAETALPALHKRGLVLHLQDGSYELRPVRLGDTEFDTFLAAIDMYHWGTDTSKTVLLPQWVKNENNVTKV